jgi:hypothetical protein
LRPLKNYCLGQGPSFGRFRKALRSKNPVNGKKGLDEVVEKKKVIGKMGKKVK